MHMLILTTQLINQNLLVDPSIPINWTSPYVFQGCQVPFLIFISYRHSSMQTVI